MEKDFHEEEYFGNVRLDESAVLHTGEDVIISMKNIHKTYLLGVEGVPALRGVSLTVKRGEFVCIFGTSGGGKTTMLNIIGTIDKPTKGEMILCGHMINHKTEDLTLSMLRLKKIGFVFQTFNLLSSLTALENVEMPMILAGDLTGEERKARAISLLTKVGMSNRLNHHPSQLSGGEQQRVTIARAMANKPEILLLDEPTGDLDTANTAIVMKLLTQLNKDEGITLVMVTHDVGLKMFSDRVIWMRDGKIQRIESITENARQESHRKLDEEIDRIDKKKAGLLPPSNTNTITRNPRDYKPLNWRQRSPPSSSPPSSSSFPPVSLSPPSSSSSSLSISSPPNPPPPSRLTNGVEHNHVHLNGNARINGKDEGEKKEKGKGRAGTGKGEGDEVVEVIIGDITNGVNGIELEEDHEMTLYRKKPEVARPLLINEEISLDDGN